MTTLAQVGEAALELLQAGDVRNDLRRRHRQAMRDADWPREGEDQDVDALASERAAASERVRKARQALHRLARKYQRLHGKGGPG